MRAEENSGKELLPSMALGSIPSTGGEEGGYIVNIIHSFTKIQQISMGHLLVRSPISSIKLKSASSRG